MKKTIITLAIVALASVAMAQSVTTEITHPLDGSTFGPQRIPVWSWTTTDDPTGIIYTAILVDGEVIRDYSPLTIQANVFLTTEFRTHVKGPHIFESYAITWTGLEDWSPVVVATRE